MAEQEIINHTKKAISVWGRDGHSLWHKIKEFASEIFIIVFAISLSISFHNWSEHKAEQKQVKVFLLGLKQDIQQDIDDTKQIIQQYKYYDTQYTFLAGLNKLVQPNKDSLHQFIASINSNVYLRPHKSRFDGFISSGKMLTIESDSLVSDILLYYQENIPAIKSSESGWLSTQTKLLNFIADNIEDPDNDAGYFNLLCNPRGKYLCKHLIPWQQIYGRYSNFIELGQAIIKQIDAEYPEK